MTGAIATVGAVHARVTYPSAGVAVRPVATAVFGYIREIRVAAGPAFAVAYGVTENC